MNSSWRCICHSQRIYFMSCSLILQSNIQITPKIQDEISHQPTHIRLQRIYTSTDTAVDHAVGPTLVCRLSLAFKQSGNPLSIHIQNWTLRATIKLKKLILSAYYPMAVPGLRLYQKLMGRMASSISLKSQVRCFLSILASFATRFLSITGNIVDLIIGQSLVDIKLAIEFPILQLLLQNLSSFIILLQTKHTERVGLSLFTKTPQASSSNPYKHTNFVQHALSKLATTYNHYKQQLNL